MQSQNLIKLQSWHTETGEVDKNENNSIKKIIKKTTAEVLDRNELITRCEMTQSHLKSLYRHMKVALIEVCLHHWKERFEVTSWLSSLQLDWRSESPERTKVVKTIKVETNELLDCWLVMTLFFSHCAGVSLFQWNLAHVSKSLDARSEIRCDILLTLQRSSQWNWR